MSDAFSAQGAFTVDIGGKFHPNWFVGGYLGLGVGGAAGRLDDGCKSAGLSCATATFRLGAQIQYNVLPGERVNPWFGYGIGLESTAASASAGGRTISTTGVGPEFAHLMGGVDFRLSHGFGIGPFIDFSIAQYSTAKMEGGSGSQSGSIEDKALHEWLQIGVRGVVFP
jgi:hypothetical protein